MSKRRNNDNGRRMSVKNLAVILVCAIFAGSALLAAVGFMSKGFTNTDVGSWFEKELNPDNLIKKENYNSKLDDELENGLKIKWKDNGEIVLSGKVDDTKITGEQSPAPYPFTSVTVEPGEVYTISSGNKSCDEKTFGLFVEWKDSDGVTQSVKVADDAVKLDFSDYEEEVTLTISIYYQNDVTYFGLQSYLRPVLVEGDTAGEFYK